MVKLCCFYANTTKAFLSATFVLASSLHSPIVLTSTLNYHRDYTNTLYEVVQDALPVMVTELRGKGGGDGTVAPGDWWQ